MMSIMCSRMLLHIRLDLKEAKTPHLQTRATADWPSSPVSPDIEGVLRKMPWRDDLDVPRESPASSTARESHELIPPISEKPISTALRGG